MYLLGWATESTRSVSTSLPSKLEFGMTNRNQSDVAILIEDLCAPQNLFFLIITTQYARIVPLQLINRVVFRQGIFVVIELA